MSLRVKYGGTSPLAGGASQPSESLALKKIYDVTKEGDNVNYDEVTLEPSSTYLATHTAWTISTGRVYGHVGRLISTPDSNVFGTVAASSNSFAASTYSGITFSLPTTGVLRWRCETAAVRVRFRVYKLG